MLRQILRAIHHWTVKPAYVRYRLANAKGAFHLDFFGEGIGFFAQLAAVLQFFRHAEAKDFVPVLRLTSPNYLDPGRGDDWFAYFFRLRTSDPDPKPYLRIGNIRELPGFSSDLTLWQAHDLFFKYVEIRPEITESLEEFCAGHAIGPKTIGVHYRGTDKAEEAALLSFAAVFATVEKILRQRPATRNLYVASDEQAFVSRIMTHFPELTIATFEDSVRSQDRRPIHFGDRAPGNYLLGRDALMNALILSRCGALVRTTSFLSAWSSIFNPNLDIVLLNTPYRHKLWFPEREIMRTATLASAL